MKNSIMVAAVLAFASLGTYAYGATTATSAMTIQAEILSSYAINCLTTTGGTANVDFALATPTASQTIGVTCTYSTNDPVGVDIVLTTTSDMASIGTTPVPLVLNSFVSILDSSAGLLGLVPAKSAVGLKLNPSPLVVTESATAVYGLKFAPDYTVQAADYTGGGITFTLGESAI
jgi:hypothetical protein